MQLKGYSNLDKLTRGGMATVYRAQQDSLDRTVAIKFLSAEFLWDEQAKSFFDQESLVIARLHHPNIIHIIDRGVTPKGRPYFVMDYIAGRELSELHRQNNLALNDKLQLLLQVCKGMAFAHKNGVVHRDIKPANILIDAEAHVYILDFGIAWLEASGKPQDEEIVGTPDYMSPEQFNAPQRVSQLSDIYALGAVMYELFSGNLPSQHFANLAESLSELPSALSELIIECLQIDPQERPASADEVGFRLLKILNGAHLKQSDKAAAKAAIGKASDKFELLDVLSHSRFGAVYLFQDKARKKLIVVKKRVQSEAGYRQARMLQNIQHENLLNVLGSSKNKKTFIVVMEYLSGGSLQDRLSRPCSPAMFVKVAKQLCSAMSAAHEQQVYHGDLRPSNILFDDKQQLKVTDFGFEKHYKNQQQKNWYLPQHKETDPLQKDIYSAGTIFYHMLTATPASIQFGLLKTSQSFEALDTEIQTIIKNMIEIQSINRFNSFKEIIPELEKLQQRVKPGKVRVQKTGFKLSYFFLLLILLNLCGFIGLYLFNPGFNRFVKQLFG